MGLTFTLKMHQAQRKQRKKHMYAFFLSVQARAEERLPRTSSAAQWVAAASRKQQKAATH